MEDIAIISEGNEIAYAKTILDLFQMQLNDETVVRSDLGELYNAVLYSNATFSRAGISSKISKVYVGSVDSGIKQWESLYDKYGMHIEKYLNNSRLYVVSNLACENYKLFFSELQGLESKFFEKEQEYIKAVGINKTEFIGDNKAVFFQKKDRERIIQAYRCLSYHLYFDCLSIM